MAKHAEVALERADGYLMMHTQSRFNMSRGRLREARLLNQRARADVQMAGLSERAAMLATESIVWDALLGRFERIRGEVEAALAIRRSEEAVLNAILASALANDARTGETLLDIYAELHSQFATDGRRAAQQRASGSLQHRRPAASSVKSSIGPQRPFAEN